MPKQTTFACVAHPLPGFATFGICSWEELLPGEASRAADALEAWRTSSACEAKLNRALRDGCSSGQLSRLITEAAAAGVKVAAARRMLKLQQLLEAAMAAADEATGASSSQYSALAAKLEAAEQGGVAAVVLEPARRLLQRLAAHEARQALEAALKPHSDWSANTHIAALRVALDKAEDVLGVPAQELAEQQQQHGEEAVQEPMGADGEQQQQQDADDAGAASSTGAEGSASQAADASVAAAVTAEPAAAAAEPAADEAKQRDQEQQQLQQQDQQQQQQQHTGPGSASKLSKAGSVSSSMHRTDSTASSVSDMPSAAAAGSGLGSGQRVCTQEGSVSSSDVGAAVAELAVRAWQLLQQHTQQLEAIDRERAEQERARKELKEVRALGATEGCYSCAFFVFN
jgi:hypothetical protein